MLERTLSFWFFVFVLIGDPSAAPDRSLLAGLPVPEEAYDVQEFSVESSRPNQLSFKVELAYPSKKVLELYAEYFAAKGWTACEGGMDDWGSFIDGTVEGDPLIHQLFRYWVKRDKNRLGLVALRYVSERVDLKQKTPTNATQHVTVLIVDGRPDLDEDLRLLGLKCPRE